MNEMAYVLQAWLPLIIWQQVEAPRYHKGYVTMVFLSATLIATALVIRVLHKKQNLRKAKCVVDLGARPLKCANKWQGKCCGNFKQQRREYK